MTQLESPFGDREEDYDQGDEFYDDDEEIDIEAWLDAMRDMEVMDE